VNATSLTFLEAIAEIRQMIEQSGSSGVSALPVHNELSRTRYFKRVKGRRSASLRERSRKRKLSR
jgi:hypothetical protein